MGSNLLNICNRSGKIAIIARKLFSFKPQFNVRVYT